MSKEKQIEKMAQDIYNALPDYEHNARDCRNVAEEMFDKDYRKQSEVAREIFEEIEKLHLHVTNEFDVRRYAELKKKHLKGDGAGL